MAEKNIAFTERLRDIIKKDLKMTREEFAAKAGMKTSTINNYFNKKNYGRVPEWDQLLKISTAVGKSVDYLLTGEEKTNKSASTDIELLKKYSTLQEKYTALLEEATNVKENVKVMGREEKYGIVYEFQKHYHPETYRLNKTK
jgi:transcriptional regulator with XRE-family HTH domain